MTGTHGFDKRTARDSAQRLRQAPVPSARPHLNVSLRREASRSRLIEDHPRRRCVEFLLRGSGPPACWALRCSCNSVSTLKLGPPPGCGRSATWRAFKIESSIVSLSMTGQEPALASVYLRSTQAITPRLRQHSLVVHQLLVQTLRAPFDNAAPMATGSSLPARETLNRCRARPRCTERKRDRKQETSKEGENETMQLTSEAVRPGERPAGTTITLPTLGI
eukprot:SAG11_NODE_9532_length_903_cov_0.700249_1_plen_221_part_00